MKLPDDLPETPYQVLAYRVHHFHDDDNDDLQGTVVVEIGAQLPGTEAEVIVPFEMTPETVIGLVDELMHQYRCVTYGLPDEETPPEDET